MVKRTTAAPAVHADSQVAVVFFLYNLGALLALHPMRNRGHSQRVASGWEIKTLAVQAGEPDNTWMQPGAARSPVNATRGEASRAKLGIGRLKTAQSAGEGECHPMAKQSKQEHRGYHDRQRAHH